MGKKKTTRKNPMKVKYKATNRKNKKDVVRGASKVMPTPKEVAAQNLLVKKLEEQKARAKGKTASKKKKALSKKISAQKKKLKFMKSALSSGKGDIRDARASVKGSDYKFSAKTEYYPSTRKKKKGAKKVAKKKKKKVTRKKKVSAKKKATRKKVRVKKAATRRKKKATKKKATKRKVTRRKKSAVKKKATKRRVKKAASKKRRSTKKKSSGVKRRKSRKPRKVTLKKGQSLVIKANPKKRRSKRKMKKNPIFGGGKSMGKGLEKWLGFSGMEIGSFALGGAFYASSNQLLARFLAPVHSALASIPVVGPALPNILVGVGLHYLSGKSKNKMIKDTSKAIGEGLIASSFVGIGVNAAQYVPGLAPALPAGGGASPLLMSGVDYTPEFGEYKQSAGDFGRGMGEVEYFPGTDTMTGDDMGDVDYTQDQYVTADFGGEGEADFGEIPEGLG